MKGFINTLIRDVAFLLHAIGPMWRALRGGFFCWRDAPTWVVRDYAAMDPSELVDESLVNLHAQAVNEMKLRERKQP